MPSRAVTGQGPSVLVVDHAVDISPSPGDTLRRNHRVVMSLPKPPSRGANGKLQRARDLSLDQIIQGTLAGSLQHQTREDVAEVAVDRREAPRGAFPLAVRPDRRGRSLVRRRQQRRAPGHLRPEELQVRLETRAMAQE